MPHTLATPILSLDVPCTPEAPATVRAALRSTGVPGECDDVVLVASELVTNAVTRSGGDPGHLLNVCVSEQRGRVLVSVHDTGVSTRQAGTRPLGPTAADALGLRLVARLAERWGADRPEGYRLWAEVAVTR